MQDNGKKIFHESWYRIADQRLSLRGSVRVHRQFYRGKKWYVLYNPFSNDYYRLRPAAYKFISRLSMKKSVKEVWEDVVNHNPDDAPGQGEVIEILAQLYQANLLHYDLAKDSEKLFERRKKKKDQKIKMTLMNILFLRIPLYDPDPLLKRIKLLIRVCISKMGALVWIFTVGTAVKTVVDNFESVKDSTQGVLAPSNLIFLYVGLVLIKIFHEFGHSFCVRRFGGEVHTIGVMFLLLMPLPYMDATASWSFRSKWKRLLVAGSGMMFEFFIASIAVILWANVGEGSLKSLLYNMFFIASVSTFLFNINPLLRFDGYYILSDLIDIPNLHQKSKEHLTYILEYYIFGKKDSYTPADNLKESFIFVVFGIASNIYRIFLFAGILVAVSKHFLLLALLMGIMLFITWIIVPVVKFHKYIFTDPKLARVRRRATGTYTLTLIAIILLFGYIPFPYNFKAPGMLEGKETRIITNGTGGKVSKVMATNGEYIEQDDTLFILENKELGYEIDKVNASLKGAKLTLRKAMVEMPADMAPIRKRIQVYNEKIETLDKRSEKLNVTSPFNGVWVSPDADGFQGRWLRRGDSLGMIVDTSKFVFVSVIPQSDVSHYFSDSAYAPEVKISGQAYIPIKVDSVSAVPMEHTELPSAALGWYGGGEIEVSQRSGGKAAVEPFYVLNAYLKDTEKGSELLRLNGRTGKIKFSLGKKPLFWQAWHRIRQLIQKHYHV